MSPSIDDIALTCIRNAALSRTPVSIGIRRTASPHEFYRYPARFSPELAASIIQAFSSPGGLVTDYFVGGGTTLVEARSMSRLAIGSDINSLSVFVSRVKTRLYSRRELADVIGWSTVASNDHAVGIDWPADDQALPYFRNIDGPALASQRQVILHAIGLLGALKSPRVRDFARCVLLRTAQWALDMRSEIPTADQLKTALKDNTHSMVAAAREATARYRTADQHMQARLPRALVLHQGLPGLSEHPAIRRYPRPQLVLTSPPYPGVYVNYHRWKLRGRLETPLPYYIAGQSDGHGLAHYTMAARSDRTQQSYFRKLESAFVDIARMCSPETWLVQVVGFNDVNDQIHRYLDVMKRAGLTEFRFEALSTADDGRLWRDVPGRRWWARAGDRSDVVQHTAREVILVHKLAR